MTTRRVAIFIACVLTPATAFQPAVVRRANALCKSTSSPLFVPKTLAATTGDTGKLTAPSLPEWDPTNWTTKRLHNKPLFRSATLLVALALAGYSTGSPFAKVSSKVAATVHVLSFATWFGTFVWTTFIAGITMYKNLPRKMFGSLQSKLFPKYFNSCAVAILLQVVTLRKIPDVLSKRSEAALGTALAMTLVNLFILEPRSTKVMFERYEMEEVPGAKESEKYKALAASFGKLHGISSLSNLIALCGGVAHGYYLASALVV